MSLFADFRFRAAIPVPRQGPDHHGRADAGPRDRGQRRHLQRGPRCAAAAAGQPRRRSPDLYPAERARHRRGQHDVLGPGDRRSSLTRQDTDSVRRLLHHRLHDGWTWRASRGQRRGRLWLVLRRHGASARARPADQRRRRWTEGSGSSGPDAQILDDGAQERSVGHREDGQAGHADGDDRRRARAVGALSVRHRDHRQRRDQPASHVGHDGDRTRAPDDGAVRPAGAWRQSRRRAGRTAGRTRCDPRENIPTSIRRRQASASTPSSCAIRSRRQHGRYCSCCSRRRRWYSSSRARTSRT